MTIMHVCIAGRELSAPHKQALAADLISAFAEVEVGHDDPTVHSGFVVHFDDVRATDLYMGPAPMVEAGQSGRAVVIKAQVMAGPWTPEMKRDVFAAVDAVVRDHLDMPRTGGGADFWMTITEIPDGAWGYGGAPISIADLAPLFAEDRQQQIQDYLTD